jgi:hypothetical protein
MPVFFKKTPHHLPQVFFCPNTAQGSPGVSYNVRKSNTPEVTGVTLTNQVQQNVNGILSCNFTVSSILSPVVSGQAQTAINLIANLYYILFASGPMSGTALAEHNKGSKLYATPFRPKKLSGNFSSTNFRQLSTQSSMDNNLGFLGNLMLDKVRITNLNINRGAAVAQW